MSTADKKNKRVLKGVVVGDSMEKTLVVEVRHMKVHPKYKKRYRVSKKYHVHDANGEYKEGDKVSFAECRPLSKTKRWYVLPRSKSKK